MAFSTFTVYICCRYLRPPSDYGRYCYYYYQRAYNVMIYHGYRATGMWGGATFDTAALHAVSLAAIAGVEKK